MHVGRSIPIMPSADPVGGDLSALALGRALDAESRSWVRGLRSAGAEREATLARLHGLLLRAARHEVHRRGGSLQLRGAELEDLANQATDDALMAITAKVDGFRGESRFTTWAYKFVMFEVSTKSARHFWRTTTVPLEQEDWDRLPDRLGVQPHERAEWHELFAALRRAVDEDLTDQQRRVFVAIVLNGVPMDAVAIELDSNRNAIYKALFDARRKLRASLAANGHLPRTSSRQP
jgi:RNA polymerase sigma-70 factor, ECF subfamily